MKLLDNLINRAFVSEKYGPINLLTFFSLVLISVIHCFNFTSLPIKPSTITVATIIITACITFIILAQIFSYWLKNLRHAHTVIASFSLIVLTVEGLLFPSGFILLSMVATIIAFIFVFPNLKTMLFYLILSIVCFVIMYGFFALKKETKIHTSIWDIIPGIIMFSSIIGSTAYFRELSETASKKMEKEIEHRKETEKKLEKLNRIYTGISENIPLKLAVLTVEGRYEYTNPQMMPNAELRNYIHNMTDIEFFKKYDPTKLYIAIKRDMAIKECIETSQTVAINELIDTVSYVKFYFPTKKSNEKSVEIICYGWEIKERKNGTNGINGSQNWI